MNTGYLRRYTDIPSLIYLLSEQKLTLLDPQSWDDSNDSHYLALYRQKKKLKSVLALCFSQSPETYHHWRVFAAGNSGVCIQFMHDELTRAVRKKSGLKFRKVSYLTLRSLQDKRLSISELPFLKRSAFEHEDEFRIIYESKKERLSTLDVEIPLECINKVTLSPWMPRPLALRTKSMLRLIDGCNDIVIGRSTLISNDDWKAFGESAR